jgi:hypothetical protein
MLKSRIGRIVCSLALFTPAYSYGALIVGSTLNIAGALNVGATFLNWNCNLPGDPSCVTPPPNQGGFVVANSTGTFAQYNGTFGLITDINNASEPLNTPISLPNFITFNLNNNETIELTFIPLGSKTQSMTCAGLMDCTPAGIPGLINPVTNPTGASAFNLDQNNSGTVASFGVAGIITDATTGLFGEITGTISSNLDGLTPEQALIEFASAGPAGLPLTYSGQFIVNSIIPEPVTLALTGAGLLGLGLLRRWRRG